MIVAEVLMEESGLLSVGIFEGGEFNEYSVDDFHNLPISLMSKKVDKIDRFVEGTYIEIKIKEEEVSESN